eukprot:Opistho-2@67329
MCIDVAIATQRNEFIRLKRLRDGGQLYRWNIHLNCGGHIHFDCGRHIHNNARCGALCCSLRLLGISNGGISTNLRESFLVLFSRHMLVEFSILHDSVTHVTVDGHWRSLLLLCCTRCSSTRCSNSRRRLQFHRRRVGCRLCHNGQQRSSRASVKCNKIRKNGDSGSRAIRQTLCAVSVRRNGKLMIEPPPSLMTCFVALADQRRSFSFNEDVVGGESQNAASCLRTRTTATVALHRTIVTVSRPADVVCVQFLARRVATISIPLATTLIKLNLAVVVDRIRRQNFAHNVFVLNPLRYCLADVQRA